MNDLRPDESAEGFGEDGADPLVGEKDLLEKGLVVEPADTVAGPAVSLVAVAEQVEGQCQALLNGFRGLRCALQPVLDVGQLRGDAVLFDLQQVDRDGTGVVGLQQLGPFVDQALPLRGERAVLAFGRGTGGGELVAEEALDLLPQLGR
ncbi:hypothetical protein [Blastococcus colisei]|uniref:hypothetical protein n=1 Tax=Blastococcus colisei TaxID=1564162 RepID=UPI00114E502C|nr:hypothetical protein [Blastococcus colisei]